MYTRYAQQYYVVFRRCTLESSYLLQVIAKVSIIILLRISLNALAFTVRIYTDHRPFFILHVLIYCS